MENQEGVCQGIGKLYNQVCIQSTGGGDVEVKIVFVKRDGTLIPKESMTEAEIKAQAENLARRFMASLGYVEKQKTA